MAGGSQVISSSAQKVGRTLFYPTNKGRPFLAQISHLAEKVGFFVELPLEKESLATATRRTRPDLICLSGWNPSLMEEMKILKETLLYQSIPIVVICEEPTLELVANMIENGAIDCLRIKTPQALLIARMLSIVKSKREADERIELLQHEALRDPLTGLWNHRYLQEQLLAEMKRCQKSSHSLACLMMDLDRFKRLNDRLGHLEGDRLLQGFARIIMTAARTEDTPTRYGGDEFCILLPGATREAAIAVGNRIKDAVSRGGLLRTAFPATSNSVSIGVAVAPEDAGNASSLIEAADIVLYQAKRLGRDRVVSVQWTTFLLSSNLPLDFVGVGGDWNAWAPEKSSLSRVSDGSWAGSVLLPEGKSRYKFKGFIGDQGHWFIDQANPLSESDGFGGVNSLVYVESKLAPSATPA